MLPRIAFIYLFFSLYLLHSFLYYLVLNLFHTLFLMIFQFPHPPFNVFWAGWFAFLQCSFHFGILLNELMSLASHPRSFPILV
ncbi:hypothetical protein BJX62DRAFT_204794 [Aspergillus germanicus]